MTRINTTERWYREQLAESAFTLSRPNGSKQWRELSQEERARLVSFVDALLGLEHGAIERKGRESVARAKQTIAEALAELESEL